MSQNIPDPTTTLLFRVERAEQEIMQLKTQLNLYVPARENELRLQSINAGVQRIEQDIKAFKDQVNDLTSKMQEQRESLDKLLIRVLWGGFSLLFVIGGGVLVGYITHFFH